MKKEMLLLFALLPIIVMGQMKDYTALDYQYLDKDFKIVVSSEKFDALVTEMGNDPLAISTYEDSLFVVLLTDLKFFQDVSFAMNQITYSWEKVGLNLWKSEDETLVLAKEVDATHPWNLMTMLQDDKNENPYIIKQMQEVRMNVGEELGYKLDESVSNRQVLAHSHRLNPERRKMATIRKLEEHGKSCGASCGHAH